MNILVIGSGGREHAICWRLKQSPLLGRCYCAPGNPGIAEVASCVPIAADDLTGLALFAEKNSVDLTIVGPELPLSLGITDHFRQRDLKIFGPSRSGAQLESSKGFAKEVMIAAGVPTARHQLWTGEGDLAAMVAEQGLPIVLKADGLASGKGVYVCHTAAEAQAAVRELTAGKTAGSRVVIEQFLTGREASFIVATDGTRIVPLAPSHDYKRIYDHDAGPNTGGMGSVSPTPHLSEEQGQWVVKRVIEPVLAEMARRGTPFRGFLYAGLMIGPDGAINVLEFNTRLGDPETQAIMRRLDFDLAALLMALESSAPLPELHWSSCAAVCLVLAAEGYPAAPKIGDEITGIDLVRTIPEAEVFQAGTARDQKGRLVTAGGRVLGISACGVNLDEARSRAYRAADLVQFRGRQLRRDIAAS